MSARLPLQSKAFRPKFENKRAVFGGDDDDEEEKVNDELVSGIEDNKLKEVAPKKKAAPLTISPLPNADWRANAKHKKELYVPARAQPQQQSTGGPEVLTQNPASFGLQIQKKTTTTATEIIENGNEQIVEQETVTTVEPVEDTPKTLEQRAIEAIIKESLGQDEEKAEGPKKVIEANETLSFRDDVEHRPEETTMEDYEKIPVDEFGAALLRGLGWSEGEGIGRNRKSAPAPPPAPVKQREALLGLGAKPEEVDKDQKSKNRRAAYEYKDTSLFKKLSKKKYEDESNSSRRRRYDDDDRSRSSSSRHSSSRRRDDDDEDERSSKHSSRHSSRHSSSSRHRDDRSPSSSSSRKRYDDDDYYKKKRRRSRSSERYSSSHSRRSSRSRSPSSRSSSSRHRKN